MQLKVDLKPRSWHTVRAAYSAVATECRLVVFGGNMHREGNYGDRTATADPRILVFGMYQSFLFALWRWPTELTHWNHALSVSASINFHAVISVLSLLVSSLFVFWHELGAVQLVPGSSFYQACPWHLGVWSGSSPAVLLLDFTDFTTIGTKHLAGCCLSVITECEALMSHLTQLDIPHNLRRQIMERSQAKINSPSSVTITVIGNPT